MLEILIITGCLASNNNEACMKMGEAYYHYEKLDIMVENVNDRIKRKYPSFFLTASLLSSIEHRKFNVPVYKGTYFGWESPVGREPKLNFGWEYGF